MTNPRLQRAAKALMRCRSGIDDLEGLDDELQAQLMDEARAVLEEFREPDRMMTEAGAEIVRNVHSEESGAAFEDDAANVWRVMIEAALAK